VLKGGKGLRVVDLVELSCRIRTLTPRCAARSRAEYRAAPRSHPRAAHDLGPEDTTSSSPWRAKRFQYMTLTSRRATDSFARPSSTWTPFE
jgi:hypothetical protein